MLQVFLLVGNGAFHLGYLLVEFFLGEVFRIGFLLHLVVNILYGHLFAFHYHGSIENGLHVADGATEDAYAVEQPHIDFFLYAACYHHVVDIDHGRLLPETVDTADALLHHHRVPGQVVVDH